MNTAARMVFSGLLLGLAACQANVPLAVAPMPLSRNEWSLALAQSANEAADGRYAAADKALADFAARFPATTEATEAMFWRALYKLDPANPNGSAREAGGLLDSYMLTPLPEHRKESLVMRRMAAALETRVLAAAPGMPAVAAARPDDRARDEELQHLKEELAKTSAELERIKRRLAAPRP